MASTFPTPGTSAVIQRRRGHLHVHETIEPHRSALTIIDMQRAWLDPASPLHAPSALAIGPKINALARTIRESNGLVVWTKQVTGTRNAVDPFWEFYAQSFLSKVASDFLDALRDGNALCELDDGLEVDDRDVVLRKTRFSPFMPGSSDLSPVLSRHGIDTLLIAGVATNVCCEATARDAVSLGYRVFVASDATAAATRTLHHAGLESIAFGFGDVRTTEELTNMSRDTSAG